MAGEPGWVNAYPNFLAMQAQQQDKQVQAWQFQQAQRQAAQQQAAQQAAGNALPQLLQSGQVAAQPTQGQMPPPPQPPAPGQSSQPQQSGPPQGGPPPGAPPQNGGGVPLPQGPQPGQVNRPPIPPGGVQGSMPPPGVPPFRPMPTQPPPQQAAPAASIAPPPAQAPQPQQAQGGPLTLDGAVKALQGQGLKGADLIAGLQQLTPLLDAQSKQQANQLQQQFNQQFKLAQLDTQQKHYEEMAKNQELGVQQRGQYQVQSLEIQKQKLGLEQQRIVLETKKAMADNPNAGTPPAPTAPDAQGNLPTPKGIGNYSGEAIAALGKDYATRGPAAISGLGRGKQDEAVRAAVVNYATAVNGQSGGNFASNASEYAANKSGARVNANQAAKVDASANALTTQGGIGDQFQKSVDDLNLAGIPLANKAKLAALRATGDPRVASFDTAQNGVVSEVAQILGRGSLTVNSMEEARRVINNWQTPEQVKAGIAQLKREAQTTVKSSREEVQKSAGTAKPEGGGIPSGWTVTEH